MRKNASHQVKVVEPIHHDPPVFHCSPHRRSSMTTPIASHPASFIYDHVPHICCMHLISMTMCTIYTPCQPCLKSKTWSLTVSSPSIGDQPPLQQPEDIRLANHSTRTYYRASTSKLGQIGHRPSRKGQGSAGSPIPN